MTTTAAPNLTNLERMLAGLRDEDTTSMGVLRIIRQLGEEVIYLHEEVELLRNHAHDHIVGTYATTGPRPTHEKV